MADANSSSGGGGGKKAEFDPVTAAAAAAAAAEGPATAAGGRGGTTDGDDTGGAAAPAGAGNAAPGAAGASQSKPSAAPVGRGAAGHVRGDSKKGGWRRFVQPFYYVNALVVVSYLLVREWYPNARCRKITETFGMTREQEICIIAAFGLVNKYRKSATLDEWVESLLLWSRVTVLVLLYLTDTRIMGWYLVLMGVLWQALPAPRYMGKRNITALNPARIESSIVKGDKKVMWLVLFKAAWSRHCDFFEPAFAELSLQYSTDLLRFGSVEVVQWPDAAKKFNIDTSHSSYELPSLILFEKGVEAKRLPPIDAKGQVQAVKLDKEGVVKYFDLDRRVLMSRS